MQTINFEPGVINTKNCSNCRFGNYGICPKINVCVTSSLDQSPSHWMEMTDAQKLEKEMSNIKTDKKLVGDISSGYSYIDTDIAYKIKKRPGSHKDITNKIYGSEPFDLSLKLKRLEQFCDLYGIDFRIIPNSKPQDTYTFKFINKLTLDVYRKTFDCRWSERNQELLQDVLIERLKIKFRLIRGNEVIKYNKMFKKENKKMDIKLYECGTFVGGVVTKPQDLIKNVIFSGPCTIVQWSDGDKTIVRCENEDFDKEKGLAMAIVKKLFGTNESKSNYNDIFKKWIQEEEVPEFLNKKMNVSEDKKYHTVKDAMYMSVKQYANMTGMSKSTIIRHINSGKVFGAKKDKTGKWLIPVPIVEV